MSLDAPLKPPLKWAGGKRWLVPYIKPVWGHHHRLRLVEPFCGGLAVAMGLLPQRALLNDINPHLINFLQWVQRGLQVEIPLKNDEALYYRHREHFNRLLREKKEKSREAAELFYYLNRTGYNGLCRFNRQGFFNVPFGRYKKITYHRDFTVYRGLFVGWQFTSMDFEKIPLRFDDFVYVDPPYDVEFRHYSSGGFSWEDQVRLAEWLASHPGPGAASNQATERIVTLYSGLGFQIRYLDGPRLISCKGDRAPAREMLALNRQAEKGLENKLEDMFQGEQ